MEKENAIHQRWMAKKNRASDDAAHSDCWAWEQCGGCHFWIPLAGSLGADWGVCANPASHFDQQAMYEHDGCEAFTEDPQGWRTPERFSIPEED
ncbi:DUF3027 domain-containing protein [Arachnia propionica]|uniref:DUF3027 domain-containing protein n=1 Tax=Arachnia propionica TaxID=1750 RepID=A0A3P1WSD1_9ACTN|nr:DUF3027 domain-containing protein [Arachnia propionica]RRD47363.1 DUF3027 domain-containing protein [Arachnia propionica]